MLAFSIAYIAEVTSNSTLTGPLTIACSGCTITDLFPAVLLYWWVVSLVVPLGVGNRGFGRDGYAGPQQPGGTLSTTQCTCIEAHD